MGIAFLAAFFAVIISVSTNVNGKLAQIKGCDIFQGNWVFDDSYPLYESSQCPFIEGQFDCRKNGRPDKDYTKYKWQPAGGCILPSQVLEQSGVFEADGLRFRSSPAMITTAVGQMAISKGRQGRDAQNIVKVYLANLRLKDVVTDVLITAYEPVVINPLSETAATVGAGLAVPAAQSGCMPMAEVFRSAVSSFKVNDWTLFGAVA